MLPLILASSSRYRKELLERLGLPFAVELPDVDETPLPSETPAETAVRLAEAKARVVGARRGGALVIGSDQVAAFDGWTVGKPLDSADALRQLRAMQGRSIAFHTGLALFNSATGRCQVALIDVLCTFRRLSDAALQHYLDVDQPYDCAGSVKAESLGIALFTRIASDDPTVLVGLPLIRLTDMLHAEGVDPLLARSRAQAASA